MRTKNILIIIGILAIFIIGVAWAISNFVLIDNSGNISSIGVSVNPTSINWGSVDVGRNYTYPVTITNTGNKIETLSMVTSGLPNYLSLTWNCTDVNVNPQENVIALFTLVVSPTAIEGTPFNFNITIIGTG